MTSETAAPSAADNTIPSSLEKPAAAREAEDGATPLLALFGTNRSGTTWLGATLDAHPEVAYRFEPFHRAGAESPLRRLGERIREGTCGDEDLAELYRLLHAAHPATDKAPFFHKRNALNFGRRPGWAAARLAPPMAGVFRRLYSPRPGTPVLFKEISNEQLMRRLLQTTNTPVVYLLRHPCGTVNSLLRGQRAGHMPTKRLDLLPDILADQRPYLYERHEGTFDQLTDAEKNALLWRLEVERGAEAIDQAGRGLIVTFEELCDDAYSVVPRVCDALGLTFDPQIKRFLDQVHEIDTTRNGSGSRRGGYFTVMRNPKTQRDRWRTQLDDQDRDRILRIVEDSPVFRRFADRGDWT